LTVAGQPRRVGNLLSELDAADRDGVRATELALN
jgi:hypothetical protein